MIRRYPAAIAPSVVVGWFVLTASVAVSADPKPPDPPLDFKVQIRYAGGYFGSRVAVMLDNGKIVLANYHPGQTNATLTEFDAATGKPIRDLPFTQGKLRSAYCLEIAPNQRIVAASVTMGEVPGNQGEESQLRVWDLVKGKELRTLPNVKNVAGQLRFSVDGRMLMACQGSIVGSGTDWTGILNVWDVAANKLIFSRQKFDGRLHAATISRDGKTLYWLSGKTLHVTDIASGNETTTVPMTAREMADNIAISPDGVSMVMVGQHLIEFYDLASLKLLKVVVIDMIGGGLPVFTSDSKIVAIPIYERVAFFDMPTGDAIGVITSAHKKYVPDSVSISADGKLTSVVEGADLYGNMWIFDSSKLDPPPVFKSAADMQTLFPEVHKSHAKVGKSSALNPRRGNPATGDENKTTTPAQSQHSAGPTTVTPAPPQASPAPSTVASSNTPPPATTSDNKIPDTKPSPETTEPSKSDTSDASAFIGTWKVTDGGYTSKWSFAQSDGQWTIEVVYSKGGKVVGSAHGVDAKIVNGTLSFTRVFDKKPHPDFVDNFPIALEPNAGHLNYTANKGSRVKHLKLEKIGG